MSASLVGSEMCIRDRGGGIHGPAGPRSAAQRANMPRRCFLCGAAQVGRPVSYTHLTLPTICSV
eukprot:3166906-Alexandrium_andersonii.AAC.1